MPCFTYDWQPGQRFDWSKAQSTWTGKIPETFGKRPGVKRGNHPLYNVAVRGPLADWIISVNDAIPLSWGEDKFYYKLKDRNGSILLLGVDHNANSTIHICQELADVWYIANKKPMSKLTLAELMSKPTKEQEEIIELHMSSMETQKDFNRIEPVLKAHNAIKAVKIGDADVRYVFSKDVIELGTAALKKNPRLLVVNK
jgi:aminoglycoside 3-N-acetyltransferase